MTDTLRSIVEGMEHVAAFGRWRSKNKPLGANGRELLCAHDCEKCRFLALLASAECDLVKEWREKAAEGRNRHFNAMAVATDACADELETWLAVNLPRIKVEARLDAEVAILDWAAKLYCQCEELREGEGFNGMCAIHNKRAALEAAAKETP